MILLYDANSVLSTSKSWKTDPCPSGLAKQTKIWGRAANAVVTPER